MLRKPRIGPAQDALAEALGTLSALFAEAGNTPVAVPHLHPGEDLLDVYGEDLRARAFLFADAERGEELCLRPDFTVPVALAHGESGWDRQAGYSYQGPVFRRQPQGSGRPVEYSQAGIERFGDPDPVDADAAVLALLHRGLAALGIARPRVTIGDLSIPFALLDALEMPAARRDALRRHFWRPTRFQALIARAVKQPERSPHRERLIAAARAPDPTQAVTALMFDAGEIVGLRDRGDIVARARRLAEEMSHPTMPIADAALITDVLAVRGQAPEAVQTLRGLTATAGIDLSPALNRFERRLTALERQNVDPATLTFDAAFGRNLEYYDGFVFEMRAEGSKDHPPLAGGGRYDAMTVRLGAAEAVGAVGGMIRPEAVLEQRA